MQCVHCYPNNTLTKMNDHIGIYKDHYPHTLYPVYHVYTCIHTYNGVPRYVTRVGASRGNYSWLGKNVTNFPPSVPRYIWCTTLTQWFSGVAGNNGNLVFWAKSGPGKVDTLVKAGLLLLEWPTFATGQLGKHKSTIIGRFNIYFIKERYLQKVIVIGY